MESLMLRLLYKIHIMNLYISTLKLRMKGKLVCDFQKIVLYQPVYLYGNGGSYSIGHNVQFGYEIGGRCRHGYCELQSRTSNSSIYIGDNTAINNNFLAIASNKISIGSSCRIGINCQIMDFEAHNNNPNSRDQLGEVSEIIIGDNVWIGNNVTILPGVHIGKNSIIGAGAVVTANVPENVIYAGVPAKFIKSL